MKGVVSQNGWQVILDEDLLRTWSIPRSERVFKLRRGPAGFVLAFVASWFNDKIQEVDLGFDDWGWSPRRIAGSEEWSNHASATALDLNADKHPYGREDTFTKVQAGRIQAKLEDWGDVIKWGGNYVYTKDEMHWEIDRDFAAVQALANRFRNTPRGLKILRENDLSSR